MCSCHQAWSHHNWLFVGLRQFSQDKQTAEENQCTVGNFSGHKCYLLYIYLPLRAKNIILICWILLDLLNCVDQLDLVCQSVRSYWSVRNFGSYFVWLFHSLFNVVMLEQLFITIYIVSDWWTNVCSPLHEYWRETKTEAIMKSWFWLIKQQEMHKHENLKR